MTEYEVKAILDGIVIEKVIVNSLSKARKIESEFIDNSVRADTEVIINKINLLKKEKYSRTSNITGIKWVWYGGFGIYGYKNKKEVAFIDTGRWSVDIFTEELIRKVINKLAILPAEEQNEFRIN